MSETTEHQRSGLIRYLYELAKKDDRGALAALRRGAGKAPGTEPATFPYVVPFLANRMDSSYHSWPEFCVASLFALNPRARAEGEGFGTTFRRLKENESRDLRFRALLNARESELPKLLRHAIRQLAADETSVDWETLLNDLRRWKSTAKHVQRRWAQQYWAWDTHNNDED